MTNAESLLCDLLNCGSADLSVLDGIGYDIGEIVENLREDGITPTLNQITAGVFRKGTDEVGTAIENKIQDFKKELVNYPHGSTEYEAIEERISELETLNPEKDIEWFCNWLDTSIYFAENEEIYRKYLSDEISEIEDNMGFEF